MKKFILIMSILFLTVFTVSCGGGSQVKKGGKSVDPMFGEDTGIAKIYDDDIALARDRAIDDAMNKLVKQKLGQTVSGRSVVEDFALIESIVETRSTGMVKNYKVIKEEAKDGHYWVTISGTVYPQAVNDTIRATLENYGRPRFMVLVKETFEGKVNMPGLTVTELTMMNIMSKAGFEFVDAAMTQELLRKERAKMTKAMSGQVSSDVQSLLLDDAGAEVIIIGESKTTDQSAALAKYNTNMQSKSAIINLKAIDVYTGRILATVSADAPAAHINADTASKQAIQKCLERAAVLGKNDDAGKFQSGAFINEISKKFLEAATRRIITINVAGLDNKDLSKFREVLENRVRGISKVYLRGSSGSVSKLEVQFAGKTEDLSDELNGKGDSLGFTINITEQFPNRIMMTVKRK
ncbi:MAG: flagellar assembly protein T N-terminal domain-containing protein [Spirochaetes bacterium]|nr:flagellar assembly protein T N-terminal domain-containing protein [Spirochaetota bacterium]